MRKTEIDSVTPSNFPEALPIALEQRTSRTQAVFFLALLLPAILAMLVPVAFLAATAVADQSAREALTARPSTTILTLAGLAIWLGLWSIPLRRFWSSLTYSRHVSISEDGTIRVEDRSLFRSQPWTAHVADFEGLRHDVRSSLSGTMRELRLVHPEPTRSLLLHAAPILTDQKTAELARLLGCRVLPSIGTAPAPLPSSPPGAMAPAPA